jgi:hypothetical protein
MLRTAQSLPTRAFDAGLRPDPFPGRAASLLPGLLAATRTGLAPAGDDELTTPEALHTHLQVRWAHEGPRLVPAGMAWHRRAGVLVLDDLPDAMTPWSVLVSRA